MFAEILPAEYQPVVVYREYTPEQQCRLQTLHPDVCSLPSGDPAGGGQMWLVPQEKTTSPRAPLSPSPWFSPLLGPQQRLGGLGH